MSADELRELVRQRQIAQLELQIHNEELRASQLAVAEACDHYRELFDYAPVGYLTLDGREAIREANNAAAAMLGAAGGVDREAAAPVRRQGRPRALPAAHPSGGLLGRQAKLRVDAPRRRGGRPLAASLEIAPIETLYPGGGELWVTMTDVTRRKRLEDRLAYLASFPEQNPNPILELDLEGEICYVNPAAERLFPDLRERGASHPFLADWETTARRLADASDHTAVREAMVGDRTYLQEFSRLPERNFIRIYGMDVTHHAEVEERLRLLSEITAKLLASDSPQELIHSLCRQVMENLDCCVFFNFLVDEAAGRLRLNASAGVSDEKAGEIEWLDGATVCGCAAAEGRPIAVADVPTIHRSANGSDPLARRPCLRLPSPGQRGSRPGHAFLSARGRRRLSARTSWR